MATPILDPGHPLAELLRRDQRYDFDSYVFVFDALRYAQERMNLGRAYQHDSAAPDEDSPDAQASLESQEHNVEFLPDEQSAIERHVTGQELCEAMRRFALEQYGLLAKSVLNHWGVRSTGDFGEIVFNLIDIGQMRKTEQDRREDFEEVFNFDTLSDEQVFSLAEPSDDG